MWEKGEISDYYKLVPDPDDSVEGVVEITGGPFAGLIYKYGDFRFSKPTDEDSVPRVEYQFEVIHIPEEIRDVEYPEEMKDSFDELLLSVLIDMVQKDATKDVRVDYDSTDGEGDTDESFERRVFYEIDNSVPEG
tara:strand:- start:413 stop:817 length:405 start_codon:yes stop_codon:yes gene_type:complete